MTQLSQAAVGDGQRRLGRDFWLLFGGQGLSLVGSETVIVAAPVVAVTVLHASAIQIGVLSAAQTVAFLLVALPAGLLVDRVGAWPAMWWSNAVRTVLAGSVAVFLWTRHLDFAGFAVLAAVTGAFAVLFDVAYPTFLPQVVTQDLLPSANSRLSGLQSVAQVSGPPVGGVLIGAAGPGGAFLLDSLSFVMSLASLSVIGRPRRVEPDERASREPWFRALTDGLRFVWNERILRAGILWSGTANIFVVMVETMGVLYLLRDLRFSAALVGLLLAFGAGWRCARGPAGTQDQRRSRLGSSDLDGDDHLRSAGFAHSVVRAWSRRAPVRHRMDVVVAVSHTHLDKSDDLPAAGDSWADAGSGQRRRSLGHLGNSPGRGSRRRPTGLVDRGPPNFMGGGRRWMPLRAVAVLLAPANRRAARSRPRRNRG